MVLFAVLLRLGFWQLDRAAQKQEIASEYAQRRSAPVIDLTLLTDPDPGQLRWRRVHASGMYAEPAVLLDNRTRSGAAGFDVYSPFRLANGRTVLVERGWVAGAATRDRYPEIDTPAAPTQVDGYVGPPVFSGLRMNDAADTVEKLQPTLVRVQRINFATLAPYVGTSPEPYIVYLDSAAPHGYDRQRQVPGDGSARHRAYATQWFTMAAILVIIMTTLIYRQLKRAERL